MGAQASLSSWISGDTIRYYARIARALLAAKSVNHPAFTVIYDTRCIASLPLLSWSSLPIPSLFLASLITFFRQDRPRYCLSHVAQISHAISLAISLADDTLLQIDHHL